MTRVIQSIAEVASSYDAIVFDQWGVLHNGTAPYDSAVSTIETLHTENCRMAVLSNSGKRAASNSKRISSLGFKADWFEYVMTSGEALWQDINSDRIKLRRFFPIERNLGDAKAWGRGLDIDFCNIRTADAILLMGLPDGAEAFEFKDLLDEALGYGRQLFCSNPDLMSPRADGQKVVSPGTLAKAYQESGGEVHFYGKPHLPVFTSLQSTLGTDNILMVGDSLDHDILGAHSADWDSVLITSGLYADHFKDNDAHQTLSALAHSKSIAPPTFVIETLK